MISLDGHLIRWTKHVIDRFGERLAPGLDYDSCRSDLQRLAIAHGKFTSDPPSWYPCRAGEVRAYLVIGDDVVLPLLAHTWKRGTWVAVTCVTRAA
jgi:hypothetical protein